MTHTLGFNYFETIRQGFTGRHLLFFPSQLTRFLAKQSKNRTKTEIFTENHAKNMKERRKSEEKPEHVIKITGTLWNTIILFHKTHNTAEPIKNQSIP